MENPDEMNMQEAWAMLRYTMIAPAANGTYTQKSKSAYYRDVCKHPVQTPDGSLRYFCPGTLSAWESRFHRFGFEGLIGHARTDKGRFRAINEDLAYAIKDIKEKFPSMNATEVFNRLLEEGIIEKKDVSLSTVQRFVKATFGKYTVDVPKKLRMPFEAPFINALWEADTLYGPYVKKDKEAKRHRSYLQMIIDDKSRVIVSARFYLADTAANFQETLKAAVGVWGVPDKLFVDNGSPYKNSSLAGICGRLGCVLAHTAVRDGASKGKIERAFRTLRDRLLRCLDPDKDYTLDELNDELVRYVSSYNARTHSSLNDSPINVWSQESNQTSIRFLDRDRITDLFRHRVIRRVREDNTVIIEKRLFDVPAYASGQKLEFRFTPNDPHDVWMKDEAGRLVKIELTDKQGNFFAKRTHARYELTFNQTQNAYEE